MLRLYALQVCACDGNDSEDRADDMKFHCFTGSIRKMMENAIPVLSRWCIAAIFEFDSLPVLASCCSLLLFSALLAGLLFNFMFSCLAVCDICCGWVVQFCDPSTKKMAYTCHLLSLSVLLCLLHIEACCLFSCVAGRSVVQLHVQLLTALLGTDSSSSRQLPYQALGFWKKRNVEQSGV